MTAPLSNDLGRRVVQAIQSGLSGRAAAAKFDFSIASPVRWYQRFKRVGDVRPALMEGDRTRHYLELYAAKIIGWIEENRDIVTKEIPAFAGTSLNLKSD